MRKSFLSLLALLAFGAILTPAEAQIQLNINTTTMQFWFSGSDTGTPWQGVAPDNYFNWKTPVLQFTLTSFDVTSAFSTPGGVDSAGLTVWNTGLHFGLTVQDSYTGPTTITANPGVVFSYANSGADTIDSIAQSLSYPLVLAPESGNDISSINLRASTAVPEPSAWILLALGALILGVAASRRPRLLAMGIGATSFLLGASGLRADIILQDTAETQANTAEPLGGTTDANHDLLAVGFNTGSSPLLFESLASFVTNSSETDTYSFTGGIYADNGGSPDVLFASFTSMSLAPNNVANLTFVTASPTILAANTTYWLLLDGPTAADRYLGWNVTSGGAPQPTLPISYIGARMSTDSGTTWSDNPSDVNLTVRAETVPEPSTWALLAMAGAGCWLLHRRSALAIR